MFLFEVTDQSILIDSSMLKNGDVRTRNFVKNAAEIGAKMSFNLRIIYKK